MNKVHNQAFARGHRHFKTITKGFSLIEVLIFVSIISLVFISSASIVATNLHNTQLSQHRLIASRYADELKEWLSSEKESDWNSFATHIGIYCFNDKDTLAWPTVGNCNNNYSLDTLYKREVTLKATSASQMSITIRVRFTDGPNVIIVPLDTVFSVYE